MRLLTLNFRPGPAIIQLKGSFCNVWIKEFCVSVRFTHLICVYTTVLQFIMAEEMLFPPHFNTSPQKMGRLHISVLEWCICCSEQLLLQRTKYFWLILRKMHGNYSLVAVEIKVKRSPKQAIFPTWGHFWIMIKVALALEGEGNSIMDRNNIYLILGLLGPGLSEIQNPSQIIAIRLWVTFPMEFIVGESIIWTVRAVADVTAGEYFTSWTIYFLAGFFFVYFGHIFWSKIILTKKKKQIKKHCLLIQLLKINTEKNCNYWNFLQHVVPF